VEEFISLGQKSTIIFDKQVGKHRVLILVAIFFKRIC
jgi:hypothetical protein